MDFTPLETFLRRVPAICDPIGTGTDRQGMWWVKFAIDIDHELAWRVVQEFGHVLTELRFVPSLWPLRDAVVESSLQLSFIRMRNALPRATA
jgi:hypothetical protein